MAGMVKSMYLISILINPVIANPDNYRGWINPLPYWSFLTWIASATPSQWRWCL